MSDPGSYPHLAAATRNFTLGKPRSFVISPDGARVVFLRSSNGTDPVQRLWSLETASGEETLLVDPDDLVGTDGPGDDLPPEERARRERAREQAGGIVRFATDRAVERAVFTLGAAAWLTDLRSGTTRRLPLDGAVVDPRIDPTGRHVAWVHEGSLRVTELDGIITRTLVGEDTPDVTWGLAEFVAAEEMGRARGYWWSPDGTRLLVTRVDTSAVQRWWIAQPVDPAADPRRVAYPAAGTANAAVSVALVGLDGSREPVDWDADAYPYLAAVHWSDEGPPLLTVQSRDQRRVEHLAVDVDGATGRRGTAGTRRVLRQEATPWIELTPGVPRWHAGDVVTAEQDVASDTRRLAVDGTCVSPVGLHIREVLEVTDGAAVVRASGEDPTHVGLWQIDLASGSAAARSPAAGVSSAAVRGGTTVLTHVTLDESAQTTVAAPAGTHGIADRSTRSPITPRPQRLVLGPRRLQACLLRPADAAPDEPLPVLLDPYGGPHAQRVLQSVGLYRTPQWFAEQGFAVLVVDGRGTPGRGLAWEHAVHDDLAEGVLADQVEALAAAAAHTALDLSRVAIRGWSFGGYLAALAVLRRPDVFAAAVAGAPVTDWRLYDTHYTERYLGDPVTNAAVYDRNSLLHDAARLQRPLLLIHGLADDNVVAAHTLQLSRALLEAGRPHEVLPLSGVTHMTPQQVVAENLLHLQVDFLHRSLALAR